jgi:protocatechuate 3,4-dioxygenase beta subunit
MPEGRGASTDEHGRYAFEDLPAGKYHIVVQKGSYVPSGYGQGDPFQAPRLLELRPGQRVQNVDVGLQRGGVIAGRITDEAGEPVPHIGVRVLRTYRMEGRRMLVPGAFPFSSRTDDRGDYRVFGLAPGEYYVSASGLDAGDVGMNVEGDVEGAVRTYFPGTPDLDEAQRVAVGPGEQVLSVNFALDPSQPFSISGTVVDSTGQPPAMAHVTAEHSTDLTGMNLGGEAKPDGSFIIRNLSPGKYLVAVRAGDDQGEFAELPVTLADGDVTGLTLVTSPGTILAGQLMFETEPRQPVTPQQFRFRARSTKAGSLFEPGHLEVRPDWTFEVRVHKGPVLIRADHLPEPWILKAVLHSGVDVADSGIDIARGERVDGVRILLSSRVATVSGRIKDPSGRTVTSGTVVVFPEDSSHWGPLSRYLHAGRPNQEGRYELGHLPPGRYLAVALARMDEEKNEEPEYLERLRGYATPFEIRDGEQRTLDLELADVR